MIHACRGKNSFRHDHWFNHSAIVGLASTKGGGRAGEGGGGGQEGVEEEYNDDDHDKEIWVKPDKKQ
jgi:hypothetical protein